MSKPEEFLNQLVQEFPSIQDEILDEDYSGLFYMQVGIFKNYVQRLIDTKSQHEFSRTIEFLNKSIGNYSDKVDGAIYTSLLEHLNFKKNPKFIQLLPPNIYDAYNQLLAYNKQSKKFKF